MTLLYREPLFLQHHTGAHPERPQRLVAVNALLDRSGFAARCRAVVRIPYDPHLEEGAEFELDYLDPETGDAYLTLSALVADYFPRPGRSAASAAPGVPLP